MIQVGPRPHSVFIAPAKFVRPLILMKRRCFCSTRWNIMAIPQIFLQKHSSPKSNPERMIVPQCKDVCLTHFRSPVHPPTKDSILYSKRFVYSLLLRWWCHVLCFTKKSIVTSPHAGRRAVFTDLYDLALHRPSFILAVDAWQETSACV